MFSFLASVRALTLAKIYVTGRRHRIDLISSIKNEVKRGTKHVIVWQKTPNDRFE
jgi:hypothetical protein